MSRVRRMVLDPLSPDLLEDPYPAYSRLREASPLCRVGPASWGVTRHEHVAPLLNDRRLTNALPDSDPQFSSQSPEADTLRRLLPTRAAADHDMLHAAMVRAFTPRRSRARAAEATGEAAEVFETASNTGKLEVVHDLAFRISAHVVCDMIGFEEGMRERLEPWLETLAEAFTPFLPSSEDTDATSVLAQFRQVVATQIERAVANDAQTLLTDLARIAHSRQLPIEDVIDNVCFLTFTGFETTLNMICTGLSALARFPDQQRTLREQPGLIPAAVEEFVRWDAPIQYTARLLAQEIIVDGHRLAPGRPVFLLLGSANHDPRVFHDPERLNVARVPNPHTGFGGGPRGCFGSALARAEGAAVLQALLDCTSWISEAREPVRRPNPLFRTFSRIDLAVEGP